MFLCQGMWHDSGVTLLDNIIFHCNTENMKHDIFLHDVFFYAENVT